MRAPFAWVARAAWGAPGVFAIAWLVRFALGQIPILLHHLPRTFGERLPILAVGSFTATLASFALAYIYGRRVRGAAPQTGPAAAQARVA